MVSGGALLAFIENRDVGSLFAETARDKEIRIDKEIAEASSIILRKKNRKEQFSIGDKETYDITDLPDVSEIIKSRKAIEILNKMRSDEEYQMFPQATLYWFSENDGSFRRKVTRP